MRRTKPVTSLHGDTFSLRTGESRGGVLGRLGFERELQPSAYVCPDCGLVRFYVDPGAEADPDGDGSGQGSEDGGGSG
jgi:hypothetical protein